MADSLMSSLQCHPPVLVEHEYSNKTDKSAARLKNGVNTCFHSHMTSIVILVKTLLRRFFEFREDQVFAMSLTREAVKEI